MNREAERKRLVELITEGQPPFNSLNEVCIEKLADHLLVKGVIVAPMSITEELRQELTEYVYKRCVDEL